MNHMETVDAIVDLARTGRQLSADEALGEVVRLIHGMCPTSKNYDSRLAALMQVGAALWNASLASRAARPEPQSLHAAGAPGSALKLRVQQCSDFGICQDGNGKSSDCEG